MENYYLITFKNTYCAIEAEKHLKEEGINIKVMPTPTMITKSCGISIKIDEEAIASVKKAVDLKKIEIKDLLYKSEGRYNIISI